MADEPTGSEAGRRSLRPHVRSRMAALAIAVGVFGLSFGMLATTAGLSPLTAGLLSLLVFAGGSQFAAVGVLAGGGSPLAAVASGLLLNARYVPFGLAIAPELRGGALRRALAAHLVIDETVALALPERARCGPVECVFWVAGVLLGVTWVSGTVAGALAGSVIGDPDALGLDVAFPAGFLALLAPLLDSTRARVSAVAGAVIAVALLPLAPPGVPVLAAALGAAVGLAVPAR